LQKLQLGLFHRQRKGGGTARVCHIRLGRTPV
jgi:hypothetical protein